MKVGAIYSTFYDLEIIERSINSINDVVDYIIIIHQKVGFNGIPERESNKTLLNDLIVRQKVAEVIQYDAIGVDKSVGILEKINIGLRKCKNEKCDYVMIMSPDHEYNSTELIREINEMRSQNIDTLYCPIRAYYYDRDHYFIDSYYFQAIHKIDDREYQLSKSSLLCDPYNKMEERKWKLSKMYLEHYTFLRDNYGAKINNSIRTIGNARIRLEMEKIYSHLMNWKEGMPALVFTNDMNNNGKVVLAEKNLFNKNNIPHLALCMPVWKRHNVVRFVLAYYLDIIQKLKDQVKITIIVVGSEDQEAKEIVESFGFNYYDYPNFPLAQKHNEMYLRARNFNPDACLKIDSDSLVSKEFFLWYRDLVVNDYDYAEIKDIYFATSSGLEYWSGYKGSRKGEGTGVGRFTSKKLLDLLDWKIWKDSQLNYGFDKLMTREIKQLPGIKRTAILCSDIEGYCVDIKCNENLTPLNDFKCDYLFPFEKFNIDFAPISEELYPSRTSSCSDVFSVIIPTMWKDVDNFVKMLNIYNECEFVKEIILIDNDYRNRPLTLPEKVRYFAYGENIYVNPAWNSGVFNSHSNKIAIINDDIVMSENDFMKMLYLVNNVLEEKMVIGIDESCFSALNYNGEIKETDKHRNRGWGTIMFMMKKSFVKIPEELKIWYGDDLQIMFNRTYKLFNVPIKTRMNVTVDAPGLCLRQIAREDAIRFNNLNFAKLSQRSKQKKKLGVAYSVFDDLEHLEDSIKSIRPNAEFINVVYQNVSFSGQKARYNVYKSLKELLDKGLIDSIEEYKPDIKLSGKENEIKKFNIALTKSIERNCTHHLLLGSDEVFAKEKFKDAKDYIFANESIEMSFCHIKTFYKTKRHYIYPYEEYFVPFIFRITNKRYVMNASIPGYDVDKSRMLAGIQKENVFAFDRSVLECLHYSYVRENIEWKLKTKPCGLSQETAEKILKSWKEFKNYKKEQRVVTDNGSFIVRKGRL